MRRTGDHLQLVLPGRSWKAGWMWGCEQVGCEGKQYSQIVFEMKSINPHYGLKEYLESLESLNFNEWRVFCCLCHWSFKPQLSESAGGTPETLFAVLDTFEGLADLGGGQTLQLLFFGIRSTASFTVSTVHVSTNSIQFRCYCNQNLPSTGCRSCGRLYQLAHGKYVLSAHLFFQNRCKCKGLALSGTLAMSCGCKLKSPGNAEQLCLDLWQRYVAWSLQLQFWKRIAPFLCPEICDACHEFMILSELTLR